jgi:hypothetical protein
MHFKTRELLIGRSWNPEVFIGVPIFHTDEFEHLNFLVTIFFKKVHTIDVLPVERLFGFFISKVPFTSG